MKKLVMTAAVLGFAASVVSAQVYSENIVGYAKNTLPSAGFSLVAPAQFGGAAGEVTLDNAFSGVAGGDKVYVYNGTTYDIYSYFEGYGWFDSLFNPAGSVALSAGDAVWYQGAASAVVMMAGEVPSSTSIQVAVSTGFNLVSNPYPVAMALDDIDVSGFAGNEKVYVYNGTTYDIYTYFAGYGWFDSLFNPAGGVEVPVGQGFWLEASAGQIVFNKQF